MLKAQYVISAAKGRTFKINKGVVWRRRDCGIMGVVVFIPTADAIRRDSGRNNVHGWANVAFIMPQSTTSAPSGCAYEG